MPIADIEYYGDWLNWPAISHNVVVKYYGNLFAGVRQGIVRIERGMSLIEE